MEIEESKNSLCMAFKHKKHVIYYGWIIIAAVIGTRQSKKL